MKSLIVMACVCVTLCASAVAAASTLPMVVDRTGTEPTFWWADESGAIGGGFDERLFGAAETGIADIVSPRATAPDGTISRIYRTVDISANNARNFAGLYHADRVLLGSVSTEPADPVGWLALERVRAVLDAQLVDSASGAVIHSFVLRADGLGADRATALDAAFDGLSRDTIRALQTYQPSVGTFGDGAESPVVVVLGAGTALPYIAFRQALRESHPAVLDVAESWATEGRVALRVDLDEGATFDEIVAVLDGWDGATIGDVTIEAVEPHEVGVFVRIAQPATSSDSATP